jgi:hypothetical protein
VQCRRAEWSIVGRRGRASSSRHAVSLSSACVTKRLRSLRCASAIRISVSLVAAGADRGSLKARTASRATVCSCSFWIFAYSVQCRSS